MAQICIIIGCAEDTFAERQRKADAAEPSMDFSVSAEHLCPSHQREWIDSTECERVDPMESEIEHAIELGRFVERLSAKAGKPEEPLDPKFSFVCDYCQSRIPFPWHGKSKHRPDERLGESFTTPEQLAKHKPDCSWALSWRKRK